jgi:tRNA pseudouridine55 synthase
MTSEALERLPQRQKQGRRRKGDPIHGWMIIDKPRDITSTRVVGKVKRLLNASKAGHSGTLDPLATGVLPVALGEATKTVPYVVDGTKSYRFTAFWGEERSTDDAEGPVVETSDIRPTEAEIGAVLSRFTGDVMQVPPAFSAIKVDGQRAYDLARKDQPVDLEARPVRIDRLTLIDCPDRDHAVFEMDCGKGSYVRALVRDLARALGTRGHVSDLCRTRVGPFSLQCAISLAELEALDDSVAASKRLLPVSAGLAGVSALIVDADQAARLKRGQTVHLVRPPVDAAGAAIDDGVLWTKFADRPVALAELRVGEVHPMRVFNF